MPTIIEMPPFTSGEPAYAANAVALAQGNPACAHNCFCSQISFACGKTNFVILLFCRRAAFSNGARNTPFSGTVRAFHFALTHLGLPNSECSLFGEIQASSPELNSGYRPSALYLFKFCHEFFVRAAPEKFREVIIVLQIFTTLSFRLSEQREHTEKSHNDNRPCKRFLHAGYALGRKKRSDGIAIATVRSIASMTREILTMSCFAT